VQGYLRRGNYKNGGVVKEGQLLSGSTRASSGGLDRRSARSRREGDLRRPSSTSRYKRSPRGRGQEELDNAVQQNQGQQGGRHRAQANVEQASQPRLDQVNSPIAIAGISNAQIGDLVGNAPC
jgi:hypothetical protein